MWKYRLLSLQQSSYFRLSITWKFLFKINKKNITVFLWRCAWHDSFSLNEFYLIGSNKRRVLLFKVLLVASSTKFFFRIFHSCHRWPPIKKKITTNLMIVSNVYGNYLPFWVLIAFDDSVGFGASKNPRGSPGIVTFRWHSKRQTKMITDK